MSEEVTEDQSEGNINNNSEFSISLVWREKKLTVIITRVAICWMFFKLNNYGVTKFF